MRAVDVIAKKRDGQALSPDEIAWFIRGVVSGTVTDYQAAAWLMAVYLRGLDLSETIALTRAMAESGRILDLGALGDRAVDKHSTGGVGDKTSLVVGPIAAACGVVVPKMSGRGLGITGGTLDKLEAIPGFNVYRPEAEFLRQLSQIGLAIVGQSVGLAPADGILYGLRDVTATVGSLPLIVSSILSKKLAGGAPNIVLDVKAGRGAFMTTLPGARALADALAAVGTANDRQVVAYVTEMDQPLGQAVGNALEVREAILTLRGWGPSDLTELALTLAGEMIVLAGLAPNHRAARRAAAEAVASGAALAKLRALIVAQGGDPRVVDAPKLLPTAPVISAVTSPVAGYVSEIDAGLVGSTMIGLGAGRATKSDAVDHAVGAIFERKIGAPVQPGDVLCTLHLRSPDQVPRAVETILAAYRFSPTPISAPGIVFDRIATGEGGTTLTR